MCTSDPRRLMDQVRDACRARQFSPRTEQAYWGWIKRYVLYHGKRHPAELDAKHIAAFLTHLAAERSVSASTQNQAASSLLFLYREVLGIPVEPPAGITRPERCARVPVVLTREEVATILGQLQGPSHLVGSLLYGSGLRLLEALQLRVKDVQLERGELVVRSAKGGHERVTMLPDVLRIPIAQQLRVVEQVHQRDMAGGGGWVEMPAALVRKYPRAGRELAWQYVFPATRSFRNPQSGRLRRHHLHESAVQRAVTLR